MTAPALADVEDDALWPLVMLLAARKGAVALTGAGISTESGIPDYRSGGTPRRKPMDGRLFAKDPLARRRYWARAFFGYAPVAKAVPHAGHRALAALEHTGHLSGVITQNVDGLHRRAGSRQVIELHGALARVRCLECGALESRDDTQAQMARENPRYAAFKEALEDDRTGIARDEGLQVLPDGDVALDAAFEKAFLLPRCALCGGDKKPDVVFHGECLAPAQRDDARTLLDQASAVLVVGSSLAVESARSLVRRAERQRIPLAIVNVGPTAADVTAQVLVQGRAKDVLPRLAQALLPRAATADPHFELLR